MSRSNESLSQRGDTLIEVLLAIVILSAVVVGTIAFMNRGHAMALDSLERSEVTAFMTEQSEILQYIRNTYDDASVADRGNYPANLWKNDNASEPGYLMNKVAANVNSAGCEVNSRPFYLKKTIDGGGMVSVTVEDFDASTRDEFSPNFVSTYAHPGSGLWVEAERPASGTGGIDYIDFHIKACWRSLSGGPKAEAKTIVRLYEPVDIAATPASAPSADPCAATPHDIALVLDASSSMWNYYLDDGSRRITRLKEYTINFIDNTAMSPAGNHASVIAFNHDGYLLQGFTSDTGVLKSAVSGITTYTDTNYSTGLDKAISEFSSVRARPDPGVKKVMIFISDGMADDSAAGIYSRTDAMKAGGVRIYTLGIDMDSNGSVMLSNMAGGGGSFSGTNTVAQLAAAINAISDELDCN